MKLLTLIFFVLSLLTSSCSKETQTEKVEAKINSAERAMKKSTHRIKEAACGNLTGDNKVECLAKKMKNRAIESKDAIVDKASEVKNKIDKDKDKD